MKIIVRNRHSLFIMEEFEKRERILANGVADGIIRLYALGNSTHEISDWMDAIHYMKDLKLVYQAASKDQAEIELDNLELKWGNDYPIVIKSWHNNYNPHNVCFISFYCAQRGESTQADNLYFTVCSLAFAQGSQSKISF